MPRIPPLLGSMLFQVWKSYVTQLLVRNDQAKLQPILNKGTGDAILTIFLIDFPQN